MSDLSLETLRSVHEVHLCVAFDSQNEERFISLKGFFSLENKCVLCEVKWHLCSEILSSDTFAAVT